MPSKSSGLICPKCGGMKIVEHNEFAKCKECGHKWRQV